MTHATLGVYTSPRPPAGRALTAREAAARLGIAVQTLYRRAGSYPFTRRVTGGPHGALRARPRQLTQTTHALAERRAPARRASSARARARRGGAMIEGVDDRAAR